MVKAFPVTNCKSDYASLFLEVLNAHIATLTKESLNDTFLFQKYFWKCLQIHDSVPSNLFTMESRQNQTWYRSKLTHFLNQDLPTITYPDSNCRNSEIINPSFLWLWWWLLLSCYKLTCPNISCQAYHLQKLLVTHMQLINCERLGIIQSA